MIYLHLIFGIILGKITGNYFYAIVGSIIPDIDHLYIIIKNKFFSMKQIIDSMKNEEKYNIRYKTPFVHSFLGLIVFSVIITITNIHNGIIFAIGYFSHLILDWFDKDEKYYLFPFKIKFEGFLPIWSRTEKKLTIISIIILIFLFI